MKIKFDIIYLDEDENYFSSPNMPGYLIHYFAQLRHESYESFINKLPFDTKFSFKTLIDEKTILSDLLTQYLYFLGFEKDDFYMSTSMVYLKTSSDFINIEKYSFSISELLRRYEEVNELDFFLVFSVLQGDVFRDGSIRYYMETHEECNHHRPHVHVTADNKYSASIDILDASILAGDLPEKYKGKVKRTVIEKKEKLIDYWNKRTDGLKIDLNYGLGETIFYRTTAS